jgi:pimeloyl-ACP methyl ester carboxylesterase
MRATAAALVKFGLAFVASNAVTPIEAAQASRAGVGKTISIHGTKVYYEEMGQGVPLVYTPGGRHDIGVARSLAQKLARKYRVILWERANTGRSDVVYTGARDVDLWSDQLAEFLRVIGIRSAYLAGPSLGGRISYVTAIRYPEVVRGLFLYLASGGDGIAERLAKAYYGDLVGIAEKQGMEAVIKDAFLAERIAANPSNRARFLAIDPGEFARVMRRWQGAYVSSDPLVEATECDFRKLNGSAIPIRIIAGCADDATHNLARSQLFSRIVTNAEFVEVPGFCDTWAKVQKEPGGRDVFGPVYEAQPMVPDLIDNFLASTEATRRR